MVRGGEERCKARCDGMIRMLPLPGSLVLSITNMAETLRISVPTVVDAARGRLTMRTCDDRLTAWSTRVVEHLGMTV